MKSNNPIHNHMQVVETNDPESDIFPSKDDDDIILESMGYKSELFRGLDAFSNFAFGFTEVSVLCSFVSMYGYGLKTGGSASILWGFIVAFFFNTIVAYSMAEICSAYPSAGSVYHWTGQLVPRHLTPLASYVCGWANFLGNAAGDAAFSYSWSTFLSASIVMSGGEELSQELLVAVSMIILFAWSLLNFFRIDKVGIFNNLAVFFHIGAILFMFISIFAFAKHLRTVNWVLTDYNNDSGFDSKTYVLMMGLLTGIYCFTGFEASAHMAEETHGSRTSAPNGVINTVLATGFGGLFVVLPVLFATTNIDEALNGKSGNAAVDAIAYAMGNEWAATFAWLVTINLFFAGVSSVAVTGRITWALMRDKGFMYSEYFAEIDHALQSPVRAIMFVFAFDALLLLLPLEPGAGLIAFYSIVGLSASGFQVSYAIPILAHVVYSTPSSFPATPKSLGGYSKIFGVVSCIWLLLTSCLFFLPTEYPVTAENMNYLIVVVAFVFIIGVLNWIFNSQYHFTGPKRTEHDGVVEDVKISPLH